MIPLHGIIKTLPNLFRDYFGEDYVKPFNDFFQMMDFETTHLMLNTGSNLEIWMVIIFVGVASSLIYVISKWKLGEKMKILVKKVDESLRYKIIVRAMS